MFQGKNKGTIVECAVEYSAPHWIVVIRNPGEITWTPLRSRTVKVEVQDEFGDVKSTRPAIQSFASKSEADTWVKENMPGVSEVPRTGQQRNGDREWFGGDSQLTAQ
jgi:hypothetical protein